MVPAATFIISFLGSLKFLESTGTGLTPKANKSIINDPNIQMSHWIESQSAHPAAVLSPHLEAIQACANSWNDSANINVGISKIRVSGESLKRMVSSLMMNFIYLFQMMFINVGIYLCCRYITMGQ